MNNPVMHENHEPNFRLSLNIELSLIIGFLALTIATIFISGPLAMMQMVFSLIFILLLPGFALQSLIFPQAKSLDAIERLGLALGLSIAVIPILVVTIELLSIELKLFSIVVAETVFIIIFALLSTFVRAQLPENERFLITLNYDTRTWWKLQNQTNRLLYSVLLFALALAFSLIFALLNMAGPANRLTEFYVVSSNGTAQDYFTNENQSIQLIIGIHNREATSAEYQVTILQEDRILTEIPSQYLQIEQQIEHTLDLMPEQIDARYPIQLVLYRDKGEEPYRMLRLWLSEP